MTKEKLKEYENLNFSDRFMFGKVMEDKERCQRLLECLLNQSIGELHEVTAEREMLQTKDGKMIRMDIFTKDDLSLFDMEMQNLSKKKSADSLELPKRSRFYQSTIDVDFLHKGHHYKELPKNNVIFICTFDPFGRGKAVYEFENRSNETPPEPLNDGTAKYFFNCTYEGKDIPEALSNFYEFVRTGKAADKLTEELKKTVEETRMNIIYRSEYLRQRELREDAIEEGREEERVHTEEERANTERERKRADEAETRAEAAEAEVERLKKLLSESKG